jgi:putative transposase
MARPLRSALPGQPQHVIQGDDNLQAIFAAHGDCEFFRDAFVDAATRQRLAIHAYVWITNHVHLLATPELEESVSKVFQSVGDSGSRSKRGGNGARRRWASAGRG